MLPLGDVMPLPRPRMLLLLEDFVVQVADINSLHRVSVRLGLVVRMVGVWRIDFEGFCCGLRDDTMDLHSRLSPFSIFLSSWRMRILSEIEEGRYFLSENVCTVITIRELGWW